MDWWKILTLRSRLFFWSWNICCGSSSPYLFTFNTPIFVSSAQKSLSSKRARPIALGILIPLDRTVNLQLRGYVNGCKKTLLLWGHRNLWWLFVDLECTPQQRRYISWNYFPTDLWKNCITSWFSHLLIKQIHSDELDSSTLKRFLMLLQVYLNLPLKSTVWIWSSLLSVQKILLLTASTVILVGAMMSLFTSKNLLLPSM